MTIAWLLEAYPSPSETFVARDIAALRAQGFAVRVWARQAGEGARAVPPLALGRMARAMLRDVGEGARVERPRVWRARGAAWARECRPALRDVEWIHAGWANGLAWMACGAARELGVPWSFSGHARDLWVEGGDLAAKLRNARLALCCTRAGAQHLRDIAPGCAAKVVHAPHGLPLPNLPLAPWQPAPDTLRVLSVGRLVPKKGFDVLLEAVAQLREAGVEMEARIVGEGPQRAALEAQIARLKLDCAVRLEGALPPARVQDVMREAAREGALFALPCRVAPDGDRDGLPNVLLEAAACGLPLVAAQAGSVSDFVDETCGQLCAPDDARALAEALTEVFAQPAVTLCRRDAALARVRNEFSLERCGATLARAFEAARDPGGIGEDKAFSS